MVCWADMVAGRLPARVRLFDFLGLLLKCDLLSRKRGVDILRLIGPHTGPQELSPDNIPGYLSKGRPSRSYIAIKKAGSMSAIIRNIAPVPPSA